jgi:L-lactate dehydrogenase complex protein LldE
VRIALFVTCVVDVMAPEVGVAAVRLLRAAGHDVEVPTSQTCCGQPAWNAGFAEEAAKVGRTTLTALDEALAGGADRVVGLAGSCTAMARVFWPEVFELVDDHEMAAKAKAVGERLDELSEFLDREGLPEVEKAKPPLDPTVAYHHSCHMLRELRIEEQPETLLDAVGYQRVPWSAAQRCCGFGGTFSVKLPETSTAMADDKLSSLAETGAGTVVGADTSCLLQLRSRAEAEGRPIRTRHIAEVLAEALVEEPTRS